MVFENNQIETYSKLIWFDYLESNKKEKVGLIAPFTRIGNYDNSNDDHESKVNRDKLSSNILKEIESNHRANKPKINYDAIFGLDDENEGDDNIGNNENEV